MDIVHCPWILSTVYLDKFHCPWILSTDSLENLHGLWKSSMDILEKFHGHTGKTPWTFSMDSLEIVQCFRSNTPTGQCPWIPWTLSTDSMDFFHWFHGLSTDSAIESLDCESWCLRETGPLTECEQWLNRKPGLRELVFEGDRTSH